MVPRQARSVRAQFAASRPADLARAPAACDTPHMAKRGPALYELIGDRPLGRHASPTPRARDTSRELDSPAPSHAGAADARPRPRPAPDSTPDPTPLTDNSDDDTPLARMFRPGHVVRMPVGYIWFAAAVVLVIGLAAYTVGYQVAKAAAEAERRDFLSQNALTPSAADDPLNDSTAPGDDDRDRRRADQADVDRSAAAPDRRSSRGNPNQHRPPDRESPRGASQPTTRTGSPLDNVFFVGPNVPDPREPGLNYLVLASGIAQDSAERLALFAGRRGLSVVRLKPNTRGLATVTTLEGLNAEAYRSPAVRRAFLANVREVGREFQADGGWTDLSDAWWDKLD